MRFFFVVMALLCGAAARAAPITALDESQWVQGRAYASAGLIGRETLTTFAGVRDPTEYPGVPRFWFAHLSAALFTRMPFGFATDVRADMTGAREADGEGVRTGQQTVRGSAAVALRWNFSLLFGIEGHLGWNVGSQALLYPRVGTAPPRAQRLLVTGPTATIAVNLDPTTFVSVQLFGRLDTSITQLRGLTFSAGVQGRVGFVDLGPVELGVALTAEWSRSQLTGTEVTSARLDTWRVGIGPSFVSRRGGHSPIERLPDEPVPSVVGVVRSAAGAPVARARVSVREMAVLTDDAGRFTVPPLAAGPTTAVVTANGFKEGRADVVVTPGTPVEVTVTLVAPNGPGTITGLVKSPAGAPLDKVKVTVDGTTSLTAADGTFSLTHAPGPVKVSFSLDGYAKAEEAVLVQPETTVSVAVTLEPVAQRSKAKLRGVISSAAGPVAKATVRIVELKLKQTVKADGRFEAEVKGGKYTLVIEAPKHVTQTRIVEVADGDQAIFQIELEKVR